jgi:hypothetical protein
MYFVSCHYVDFNTVMVISSYLSIYPAFPENLPIITYLSTDFLSDTISEPAVKDKWPLDKMSMPCPMIDVVIPWLQMQCSLYLKNVNVKYRWMNYIKIYCEILKIVRYWNGHSFDLIVKVSRFLSLKSDKKIYINL